MVSEASNVGDYVAHVNVKDRDVGENGAVELIVSGKWCLFLLSVFIVCFYCLFLLVLFMNELTANITQVMCPGCGRYNISIPITIHSSNLIYVMKFYNFFCMFVCLFICLFVCLFVCLFDLPLHSSNLPWKGEGLYFWGLKSGGGFRKFGN